MKKVFFFILLSLMSASVFAQTKTEAPKLAKLKTWQLLDYQQDTVYGTSVNRAYTELLKGKKSHQVIVAVIDEGVDITHEDLQGHIWTNKKEIPGNGIDDDKNGYTDDVHGWNFLGGKNGKMMYATSSEADREYARLLPTYGGIKDAAKEATDTGYQYFLKVKKKHLQDSVDRKCLPGPRFMKEHYVIVSADSLFEIRLKKKHVFISDINAFQPLDEQGDSIKNRIVKIYTNYPALKPDPLDSVLTLDSVYFDYLKTQRALYADFKSDPFALRKEIVGDDPYNINDKNYGNNIVGDKEADHGTHCSGIIAAIRNNGLGMDGITDNVLIMPIRAANSDHIGDESDKDIALAIRYAVDNGAQIISMSFGKHLSPQKQWVDDAVKYAEKKGVLLIHGAGNDSMDIDTSDFYPSPNFLGSTVRAKNFITVGAMGIDTGVKLPAYFSSFGQKGVDVFAPGVDIYSCVPGNKYQFDSGTSMATPVVAGVAALILEYYPALTAEQVKDIIMRSVTSLKGKMVYKPGTEDKVDFSTLCVSGGIVNAYKALELAAEYKKTHP